MREEKERQPRVGGLHLRRHISGIGDNRVPAVGVCKVAEADRRRGIAAVPPMIVRPHDEPGLVQAGGEPRVALAVFRHAVQHMNKTNGLANLLPSRNAWWSHQAAILARRSTAA